MRKILAGGLLILFFSNLINAQLTVPPDGGNKKAMVGERIGITDVTIHYDRPGVKGREGKVWGQLVHVGFSDLGFGSSKASPWRAGANENTTIEFSTDVMIEGQSLPAGKYGFFIAYDPAECTLIFSRNSSSWGSYFYRPEEDVLRVKVKPVTTDRSVERLKYEFGEQSENSAKIILSWEKLSIPFKVEVDLDKLQFESFRRELRGERSFSPGWQSFHQAARYAADRNKNLEEGLAWADIALNDPFSGETNFQTLSSKAELLAKLGRMKEADSLMKKALAMGTVQQVHQYGRILMGQKRNKEALDVFTLNYQKNPGSYTTLIGMTRGHSATGDYKNALKYATLALAVAPDAPNKKMVEGMIEKLKEGKDAN